MGLENGIELKVRCPMYLPEYIERRIFDRGPGNTIFTLMNWCSRWELRRKLLDVLGMAQDEYERPLRTSELESIIKVLMEEFEETGNTVFVDNVLVLRFFQKELSYKSDSDYNLVFYDSY